MEKSKLFNSRIKYLEILTDGISIGCDMQVWVGGACGPGLHEIWSTYHGQPEFIIQPCSCIGKTVAVETLSQAVPSCMFLIGQCLNEGFL